MAQDTSGSIKDSLKVFDKPAAWYIEIAGYLNSWIYFGVSHKVCRTVIFFTSHRCPAFSVGS